MTQAQDAFNAAAELGLPTFDKKYVDVVIRGIKEANATVIKSDTTGVTGADQITNMISLTQAEYDAIGTPDANTFYVITA